jgi:hypothetical protein
MNVFYIIWVFALILLFPFLPQVVGFISYTLLKRHNDLVAHILGVIIPPVASFYSVLFLVHPTLSSSPGKGEILVLFGSFLHSFFSLLIQLAIHNRHKLNVYKLP